MRIEAVSRLHEMARLRANRAQAPWQSVKKMNRMQVIGRLDMGRMLEAELRVGAEGVRTFIEVRPIIDESRGFLELAPFGIEPKLSRTAPNTNAICRYQIRLCALHPGWETEPDDWDRYVAQQSWYTCVTLRDLERYLVEHCGIALDLLRLPGGTDSPL